MATSTLGSVGTKLINLMKMKRGIFAGGGLPLERRRGRPTKKGEKPKGDRFIRSASSSSIERIGEDGAAVAAPGFDDPIWPAAHRLPASDGPILAATKGLQQIGNGKDTDDDNYHAEARRRYDQLHAEYVRRH